MAIEAPIDDKYVGSQFFHGFQAFDARREALCGHLGKRFQSLLQKRPAGLTRRVRKKKAGYAFDEDLVVEQVADLEHDVATYIVRCGGDLTDDLRSAVNDR